MKSAICNYALLFAGCLAFHVLGTWILPLIDRDEPRFAEASREMIERGDYVVPFFNNVYRFDKPPFTYWAQILSFHVFGENDFAARFASCLAAALTALCIFAWGKRIAGERVGIWAAVVFTLSLQVVEHAKAAVADMWLVLFVTLAHSAGYELMFGKGRTPDVQRSTFNAAWWIFYLSLALAFLAKGPIGWAPLLTVAVTAVVLRELELLRRFKFVLGLALTIALVAIWGIPALLRTHGEFFNVGIGKHVVARSLFALEGHGPKSFVIYLLLLPFFFLTVFFSFLPWSLKLPWLVRQVRVRRDKIDIYLLSGIAVVFVTFTLVTTKLLHYTLPAFPLLALLFAKVWISETRPTSWLRTTAVIAASCYAALAVLGTWLVRPLFPAHDLFNRSRDYLRPEMSFAAVDYTEPTLVWYFRSRVRGFMHTWKRPAQDIRPFMEEPGPRFVVLPTRVADSLYPTLPENWERFSTRGFNAVKGKRADLTLLLKPD